MQTQEQNPNKQQFKIAIIVDKDSVMWAPVQPEAELLPALDLILHPEKFPPECQPPKDARDLLALVLSNVSI